MAAERIGAVMNRVLDDIQATRAMRAAPPERDTYPLIKAMSEILLNEEADLGDGRVVISILRRHFSAADALALHEHAVEMARSHLANNPRLRRAS